MLSKQQHPEDRSPTSSVPGEKLGTSVSVSCNTASTHLETTSLLEFHNISRSLGKAREQREQHATTDLQTFVNLFKANFGPGFLALPLAFKRAGIVPAVLGLFLIGILATHCIILLLDVAASLHYRNGRSALNYAQVVRLCVEDFTGKRRLAAISEVSVNIFLVLSQLGFCAIYFVFMGENLSEVFCSAFGVHLDRRIWIAMVILPVVLATTVVRTLEGMVPFCFISNILLVYSITVIFYGAIHSMTTHNELEKAAVLRENSTVKLFATTEVYNNLPLFFASIIYSFECIGIVLPTENRMKRPHHAKVIFGVTLSLTMFIYTGFGTLGYLMYGDSIRGSITLNLVSTRAGTFTAYLLVRLFFSYIILVSFMLQFYVPMDFLEPVVYNRVLKLDHLTYRFPRYHGVVKILAQTMFRVVLVLLIATVSVTLPDLSDLLTLIGALASSSLALIIPPTLEALCFWRDRGQRRLLRVLPWPVWLSKDIAIVFVGLVAMVLGVYTSCRQIKHNFFNKPQPVCDILG